MPQGGTPGPLPAQRGGRRSVEGEGVAVVQHHAVRGDEHAAPGEAGAQAPQLVGAGALAEEVDLGRRGVGGVEQAGSRNEQQRKPAL